MIDAELKLMFLYDMPCYQISHEREVLEQIETRLVWYVLFFWAMMSVGIPVLSAYIGYITIVIGALVGFGMIRSVADVMRIQSKIARVDSVENHIREHNSFWDEIARRDEWMKQVGWNER